MFFSLAENPFPAHILALFSALEVSRWQRMGFGTSELLGIDRDFFKWWSYHGKQPTEIG